MRLVMQPTLWAELGLGDPDRYWLALCCFYLGKGGGGNKRCAKTEARRP